MTSLETVLQGKDTTSQGDLHVSFELGDRSGNAQKLAPVDSPGLRRCSGKHAPRVFPVLLPGRRSIRVCSPRTAWTQLGPGWLGME